MKKIELYDTTLRDGAQGAQVSFSLADKLNITKMLDEVGIDYIEGGYPLSNPKDEQYFKQVQELSLKNAKVTAFGMTRRKGIQAKDDTGMQALVGAKAPVISIVGKTWDLHVDEVLRVSRQENLDMIRESIAFCLKADHVEQVFYDAEHFFDGYRANKEYALKTLEAAAQGGAGRLVLCDTNGGSLPDWISQVVKEVRQHFDDPVKLGFHNHNDCDLATANCLVAVQAGCVQVQGTINGIGERCGNADLTAVAANLNLKLGCSCLAQGATEKLTRLSNYVYELANMSPSANQAYVGSAAFAHKGGMHVHAVQKFPQSYEHVPPQSVGNKRKILVSELSGGSNVVELLGDKFDIKNNKDLQRKILNRVQDLENQGYQFEAAKASFELLTYEVMGQKPKFWDLDYYRCIILKQNDNSASTEASVKLLVDGSNQHHVATGDGPVNSLDGALRKCLQSRYPQINEVHLADYKVRIINPTAGSAAKVRVRAEFTVPGENKLSRISTIGVDDNIVEASWQALKDAFVYYLMQTGEQG